MQTSASFHDLFSFPDMCTIFLLVFAFLRMTKLLFFSVHDTLSILLKNYISVAFVTFFYCLVIDHDLHP